MAVAESGRGVSIAALVERDCEPVVRVLARAFRDSPLDRAVIGRGRDRRMRSITHAMRTSLRSAMAGGCTVLVARSEQDPVGALLAAPSEVLPLPPPPLLAHLRSLFGQGLRVSARWGEVYRRLEAVRPSELHWYLSLLGVYPTHQRCGVGASLLRSWLDSIERDGLPSYLETDREENVRFYARMGFSVEVELMVLETNVWCLRRPPP